MQQSPSDAAGSDTPTRVGVSSNSAQSADKFLAIPGPTPPAETLFGRYEVRRRLGKGGFGEVYLGHDTQLDRLVAIKVMHAEAAQLSGAGEEALREARKLAQLRHPGIVAVHDIGVQNGRVYMVSDYLDGLDLGRWLR